MFEWHPFCRQPEMHEELKDHYYYLVTHRKYKTPMKAKWHSENGGAFEVYCHNGSEFWYSWDPDNPIIAWMEMPEIYHDE